MSALRFMIYGSPYEIAHGNPPIPVSSKQVQAGKVPVMSRYEPLKKPIKKEVP